MLTIDEIIEIMGGNPDEVLECGDGFLMSWGKEVEDLDELEKELSDLEMKNSLGEGWY